MKRIVFFLMLFCIVFASSSVIAGTVAYWRFEEGPAGAQVPKTVGGFTWEPSTADSSGNGYDLSVWDESGAGYVYRDIVAFSRVGGYANNFSVKNSGGGPAMWTNPAHAINGITPAAFTIEATFKLENGGYRTIIGRDSYGTNTAPGGNLDLAALYFQAIPDNALAIKFCDVSGYWHEAVSPTNAFRSFDFPSNNDGTTTPWYSMAAVSDGATLSLYLNDIASGNGWVLIAQTDMTLSGSPDTSLTAGLGGGGDWNAGDFSVGRGLYAGGHGDRAWGFIDEVRISDSALTPAEFLTTLIPYDPVVDQVADQINGDVDVTLNWKAAKDPNEVITGNAVHPDIVDQYIFMAETDSAEPNMYYVGATNADPGTTDPTSSFAIDLNYDATYQWVVVEAMEGHEQTFTVGVSKLDDVNLSNIIGQTWMFETLSSIPSITKDPNGVLVDELGTAEFSVVAESISPKNYAWWKSEDKANDTIADDTDLGVSTSTLTLSNVDELDEGFYYCVVSNDSSTSVASNVAFLEIKRLVAWYAFDGDITDSENDNDGTRIKSDPNFPFSYTTGITNQAVSLLDEEAVEIPRTIQNSMTIELWVKTTSVGGDNEGWWSGNGLVDGDVPFEQNDFGVSLYGNSLAFGVGDISAPSVTISSTSVINDGVWHYCVVTRDHVTGEILVYVDGEQEASAIAPLGTKDSPEVLLIGAIQAGGKFLIGEMDEVKLYNYPLTALTIATNYYAITGVPVCVESDRPDAQYDLNGDCIVNLVDFSEFASVWLDCGIYPDCF